MKLSITDEFLLDLYGIIERVGDVADFMLNPHAIKYMPGLKNPIFKKYRHQKNKIKFNNLIHYLKKNNYIKVKNLENKKAIILTKDGLDKALKASFKIGLKNKRKDGRWVMLIFDIPQKYRKSRDVLRSVLYDLGYKMFQQSVWVTPYDVSEKTERSLQFYSLEKFVKIFLIEEI